VSRTAVWHEPFVDLDAEFLLATEVVKHCHFDALERAGVNRSSLFRGAMKFGVEEIVTADDGLYQPLAGGHLAYIVPVIPLKAAWEEADGDDDLGDLVAWHLKEPQRWWRRCGLLSILNPGAIAIAERFGKALHIRRSPLSWLQHNSSGCVILDRHADLRLAFGGVADVVAEDLELGEEIERRLREPPVRTRVLVARPP
jgi:hypothetical protein